MPLVKTAAAAIWYADHRDRTSHRPVTVLVHGAGGTHLDWPAELRRLPEANAICPDLPGHGRSPLPGRQSVGAYAADILALLDTLGLERVFVAGHSMGSAIALTLALHHPVRILGLILIGASARLAVHPDILNVVNDKQKAVNLLSGWYWGPSVSDSLRRQAHRRLLEFDTAVLHGDYVACQGFDLRSQLDRIRVPALVIAGTHDQLTPYKYGQFLAEQLPSPQLVTVTDGGHLMHLEQPQFVADAVQKWLNARSGA